MRGTANLFSLPLRGGLELLSALGAERQPQTVITKVTNESLLTFFFTSGRRLEPIYSQNFFSRNSKRRRPSVSKVSFWEGLESF